MRGEALDTRHGPAEAPSAPLAGGHACRRPRRARSGHRQRLRDNDAGGITTYSLAGAKFGYDLLWVLLATQIALFITQEIGARIGLASGQGLTGLIRERFGVRWAAFAALTMIGANLGSTVSEFAGISAALSLFGVPTPVSAAPRRGRGDHADLARQLQPGPVLLRRRSASSCRSRTSSRPPSPQPDWPRAINSLVVPHGMFNGAYMLAVVGTVGTTITPWGQGFIQAYVVDKRLRSDDLAAERIDVLIGVVITNVIAFFIVVACAATLWASGPADITSAADAAAALGPSPATSPRRCSRSASWRASLLGPRRRSARERLHRVRGVRLGAGRGLALARRAGVLRPPGVLHRLRRPVHAHPGLAADPGHVQRPGDQWPPAAGHPRLRHAPRAAMPDHGPARQRAREPDARLARHGHPRRDVARPGGDGVLGVRGSLGGNGPRSIRASRASGRPATGSGSSGTSARARTG